MISTHLGSMFDPKTQTRLVIKIFSAKLNSSQHYASQYKVDSFTTPFNKFYHVHVILGEQQQPGTVNNCTCSFFSKHHSACKYMFLVAHRTKFQVVAQVAQLTLSHAHGESTPPHSPTSNLAGAPPASNTTAYPQLSSISSSPHASTAPPSSQIHPSRPPPASALQPTQEPRPTFPHFSLNSFIRMVQGKSSTKSRISPATTSWAQKLQRDGLLQTTTPHSAQQSNYRPFHQLDRPPFTSTPLNPAAVNAEELNVYWEDACKLTMCPLIKTLTYSNIMCIVTTCQLRKITQSSNLNNTNITHSGSQQTRQGSHIGPDVTEEIVKSSLPAGFAWKDQGLNGYHDGTSHDDSFNDQHSANISTTTLLQKEYSTDNIWRTVSKINDIQTQQNHEHLIHKQTLSEIEAFESKVEEWIKEYCDFVDDGTTRKQPRFWLATILTTT